MQQLGLHKYAYQFLIYYMSGIHIPPE
jgi:hypothetical protein